MLQLSTDIAHYQRWLASCALLAPHERRRLAALPIFGRLQHAIALLRHPDDAALVRAAPSTSAPRPLPLRAGKARGGIAVRKVGANRGSFKQSLHNAGTSTCALRQEEDLLSIHWSQLG